MVSVPVCVYIVARPPRVRRGGTQTGAAELSLSTGGWEPRFQRLARRPLAAISVSADDFGGYARFAGEAGGFVSVSDRRAANGALPKSPPRDRPRLQP